jgi:phosphoglycolate phosphatase
MQRLILFDIDGTLTAHPVGHIEAHAVAYQKVFGLFGSIYMIDYAGKTDLRITKEVLASLGVTESEVDDKLPEFFDAMGDYFDTVKPFIKPVILPGVVEVLEMLSASDENILGLVTGNLERIAHAKLQAAGLNKFFTLGGFGNESDKRPELVRNAIEHAVANNGFVAKQNVYLIGDTPLDIEAGNAAGVKTIGVATGSHTKDDLRQAGATTVLDDLTDKALLTNALDISAT